MSSEKPKPKFCVDCKYVVDRPTLDDREYLRYGCTLPNMVDGISVWTPNCYDMRRPDKYSICGYEGRLWEPKT